MTVRALRATAQRIGCLQAGADQPKAELTALVGAVAPGDWKSRASVRAAPPRC